MAILIGVSNSAQKMLNFLKTKGKTYYRKSYATLESGQSSAPIATANYLP